MEALDQYFSELF